MAQDANTFDRYDLGTGAASNVREDFSDVIYNISPTEVPFTTNVGRETSDSDYKEWSVDSLAAARDNKHIDGDEFGGLALDPAERIGNYHQISRKDLVVSRRANKVRKAGRRKEMAYQIAKKGKELRRDVEYAALLRKVAKAGAAGTPSETAGVPAWIRTNASHGATGAAPTLSGGATGYPNSAGTVGTARALSEAMVLSQSRAAYEAGGSPNMVMLPPQLKQGFSNYLFSSANRRIATPYQDHGKSPKSGVTVVGAVDVYVSDFQVLDLVPNRFSPASNAASEVFVLDTEYWALTYLDGYKNYPIAKIGDHERRMLLVDWGVESQNEGASGIVTAINQSAAVVAG